MLAYDSQKLTRRAFHATILSPLAGALARAQASSLEITDVRVKRLKVIRELGSIEAAWNPGTTMQVRVGGGSYIEILTNQGLTGIGPGMSPALLPAARRLLIGADPTHVEALWLRLQYFARGSGYQGSAGLDIALWDLIGKVAGQPLYKLWGAARDRVPAYASLVQLSTPEERADLAVQLAEEGWPAIKLRLHYETMREDLRLVELVKKAAGDRMVILTDANQAQSSGDWQPGILWDLRRAIETARELERMGVFLLEEPRPRFHFDELAEMNGKLELPLAGGENNRLLHEFRWMVEKRVFDILQPECMVLGGITPLLKIGAMGRLFNRRVMPHHGGGQLGTVAHLHLIASWTHAPYWELLHDPPSLYDKGFAAFQNPPVVKNGFVEMPQGPGLGIEIDPDMVEADAG